MTNSTRGLPARKPAKLDPNWRVKMGLHPQFPLFPHQSGRWAKKVRRQLKYFGKIEGDPKGKKALEEWNRVKDDLIAGRKPRETSSSLTIADLCNKFLASKRVQVEVGKLSARSFVEYRSTTDLLVSSFGRNRVVDDLRPIDFEKLYAALASKHGMGTIGREITHCRSVFKFGAETDLITRVVKFGPTFRPPGKSDLRKHRAKQQRTHGKRLFEAADIRKLLEAAGPQYKAMLLLAINGGMGNTDVAALPISAIDLKAGWLDYPRPKTGIERRIPLWPETIEALKAVLDGKRKKAKRPQDAGLVFLTRLGQPWVRYELTETPDESGKVKIAGKADDAVAKEMRNLLNGLGIYRRGLSYYTLRHTFETVAGGTADQVAVDAIMGHADDSMAANYRHDIGDDRLRRVVEHVRQWLFGAEGK